MAGDYEVGEISALDLVEHSKSENRSGMGGLVKISKLFDNLKEEHYEEKY